MRCKKCGAWRDYWTPCWCNMPAEQRKKIKEERRKEVEKCRQSIK
jgi:hypothetical protein